MTRSARVVIMNDRNPVPGLTITVVGLFLIVVLTLFPYEFLTSAEKPGEPLPGSFDRLSWNLGPVDWLLNILLFIPFGFGLACVLANLGLSPTLRRGLTVGTCIILTATIEFLQLSLPRMPAYSDLIANTLGGVLGLLIFEKHGQRLTRAITRFTWDVVQLRRRRLLIVAILGYLAVLVGLFLISRSATSLRNWDDSYHLILGNEHTANRPWLGEIHELVVAGWDFSPQEIARLLAVDTGINVNFDHPDHPDHSDHWLHAYRLDRAEDRLESSGYLPELDWLGHTKDPADNGGVHLSARQWLESREPATRLIHALKTSNRFSLHAVVTSLDSTQVGPARIVSISPDPYHRNFTIGQDAGDLVIRLRTPFTGENGMRPEMIVPDVFHGSDPLNLVVTYNGSTLEVYVNEATQRYQLELGYAAALCWGIFPFDERDLRGYKTVCLGLVATPLLMLGLFIFLRRTAGAWQK